MTTRRKRGRECLEAKRVDSERELQKETYTGRSKRKRDETDYVEVHSDGVSVFQYLGQEISSTSTTSSQRACKRYTSSKIERNIGANSLSDKDNSISDFRSRVTKTYRSPKKSATCTTVEGKPSGSVPANARTVAVNISMPESQNSGDSSEGIQDDIVEENSENGEITMVYHTRSSDISSHNITNNTADITIPSNGSCQLEKSNANTLHKEDNYRLNEQSLTKSNGTSSNVVPLERKESDDVIELPLTRDNCNDVAASPTIPLSYNFSTIAPAMQPMYGAGLPSTTNNLTSPIVAVATPITSVPVLPEIVNRVPLGTVGVCSSNNQGIHNITTSNEKYLCQVISNSNHSQGTQGGPSADEDNKETNETVDNTKNTFNSCDTIPVEENYDSVSSDNGQNISNSPDFLQIENWGTYLLQRLEHLYEKEQECDLILKFYGGETLKVHRAVIVACTSIVSDQDNIQHRREFSVPPDLSYSHVEPVIRFMYSGRLDTQGLQDELGSIYSAAHRLKVPLLTRLMDSRFPHLAAQTTPQRRFPIWKRNPKFIEKSRENVKKKGSKVFQAGRKSLRSINKTLSKKNSNICEVDVEKEECERQDGSVYILVPKNRNIIRGDGTFRSKFTPEKARPTRFELDEDSEPHVQIATWSSKTTSVPPFFPPANHTQNRLTGSLQPSSTTSSTSLSPFDAILASSTPLYSSVQLGNANNSKKNTMELYNNAKTHNDPVSSPESEDKETKIEIEKIIDSIDVSSPSEEVNENDDSKEGENVHVNGSEDVMSDDKDDLHEKYKDEIMNDNEDCGSITSVQKQQRGKETTVNYDTDEPCESKTETDDHHDGANNCPHTTDGTTSKKINGLDTPSKSILKKKKNRQAVKEKKHVSFPLNENDEVINEVATYSHAKEPAQSLIEVKKNIGSLKPASSTYSPVKLTLSLKKKVLMNVSLGDSEGSEIKGIEKMRLSKKESIQSKSQDQTNKGDLSNHAKLISEVLKKYPHLVKDKKNVRLKILNKGNDRGNGGKSVKSRVQYIMLSESESKEKSGKFSKSLGKTSAKNDPVTSGHTLTNTQSFQCPECENVFQSYFTFKKHVTSVHKDQSTTILAKVANVPYACYTCFLNEPLEFSDYYSYQQHMQEIHSNTETRACNICGFRPKRKLELAYHQYSEHNKVPRNFSFPKCDLCDYVAMNDAALLKHRSQHANSDSYTCSVCGVTFCSFGALQGHMQTKLCQSKPTTSYKCPHCDLTFARSYSLKVHCKSSHRSIQSSVQVAPKDRENKTQGSLLDETDIDKGPAATTSTDGEQREQGAGSGNITIVTTQSSSEAEALSTVASSLAASLGLPEETVNQYMYTQGCTLEGEKGTERVSESGGVSIQIVDATAPVSSYQEDQSLCQNTGTTFTTQSPVPSTTNVGNLYPVSVVSNQLVPGQILPSQLLQGSCLSTTGGSVLGPVPHSWTYVTYQVPSTGDELPTVLAEATSINAASVTSQPETTPDPNCQTTQDLSSHQQVSIEVSENDKSENNAIGSCEQLNSLVVVTNTGTQIDNITQGSIYL